MRNPERRILPAKTPHLRWLEIQIGVNSAGQEIASVLGQWDDHDVPVELLHIYFDDLVELGTLARHIYAYRYLKDLLYRWSTIKTILRGGSVPYKLNESKGITRARAIRGAIEDVTNTIKRFAASVRSRLRNK